MHYVDHNDSKYRIKRFFPELIALDTVLRQSTSLEKFLEFINTRQILAFQPTLPWTLLLKATEFGKLGIMWVFSSEYLEGIQV